MQAIYDHLLDLKPDGTFRLNMDYFNSATARLYFTRLEMTLEGVPFSRRETGGYSTLPQ